jgi:AraC-like DNA-binding protein
MMTDGLITARFSTEGLPERDRVAVWRERYGRQVLRLEVEPQPGVPFHADVTTRMLHGLATVSGTTSPIRVTRTRNLLDDGNSGLVLQLSGAGMVSQLGREVTLGPDYAAVLSNADVGTLALPPAARILSVSLPRTAFSLLQFNPDEIVARPIPRSTEAMRLLRHHLAFLKDSKTLASAELAHLFTTHTYDLIALALGATRDAAEIAQSRGLPAARRRAIKSDILANLHRADLTVTAMAKRHGISPRHVQRLFDAEGETFSQFVLKQRLLRAHRMLTSLRHAHVQIGAIALDVGFVDLSHFNHAFRRLFGATPSDVRAAARHDSDE